MRKYIIDQDLKNAKKIAQVELNNQIHPPIKIPEFEFREKLHEIILDQMLFGHMNFDLNKITALYLYNTLIDSRFNHTIPFNREIIQYAQTFSLIFNNDPIDTAKYIINNHSSDDDISMFLIYIGIYCQFLAINEKNDETKALIKSRLHDAIRIITVLKEHIDSSKHYPQAKGNYEIAESHVYDIVNLTGVAHE